MTRPAFYADVGTTRGDLFALLHLPYTAWHLAFVAIGAGLAPEVDWLKLAGTLVAFAFGLGVGAHALDEYRDRPLHTGLADRTLIGLGVLGLGAALAVGAVGTVVISPWVLPLAVVGVGLAAGYALEWWSPLHTDLGFALSWGAFPVLVGYWTQAETVAPVVLVAAAAATVLSLAQRALSTPARHVRRRTTRAEVRFDANQVVWGRDELLRTWEAPLRLVGFSTVLFSAALLARHL